MTTPWGARRSVRLDRPAGAWFAALLLVLAAVGFGVVIDPRPAAAADGESISAYAVTLDVGSDGRLHVIETIDYDFGTNQRHGIFRNIPDRFRYDDRRDRVYPISGVVVTMDGQPAKVDESAENGNDVLQIGDAKKEVTGAHQYVISYTVQGALNHFADHEELYWNAIGTEWTVPIAHATTHVSGPSDITRFACFVGGTGSQQVCEQSEQSGAAVTFGQPGLGNGAGMTVVVAFPAGSVANTAPILVQRHDLANGFRATTVTVILAVIALLLGVGAAVAVLWLVGRDRRYVGQLPGLAPGIGESDVERRKPLFGAPPVSVEFVPPDKVRPGQVGTLIDEQANVLDVTATILDFAVRRHLLIRELPLEHRYGGRDWELSKLTDGDPAFLPYESKLFDSLFAGRDTVRLSELKNTFASDLGQVQSQLYDDMITQRWYRRSPASTRQLARLAGIGVLVATALITFGLTFIGAGLVGLGLVLGALVLLVFAGRFPARTGRGSAMLARIQGFRLYIATAEAEQIKFQEREQIFSAYLPYAMVFGLADRWAGIFADLGSTRSDGSSGLYWYAGALGWSMLDFNHSIGSFATTTVGTIATTPPSASGSSGFSGGFSGGGGGGGGGGSW